MPRFVDISIFNTMSWQTADTVISSGPKQGTNWLLNIVHQLRMAGDDTFQDILTVCLWPEIISYPGEDVEARLERAESHKTLYPFRIFKTHEAPPVLPLHLAARYIIPVRNGRDTLVSDYYFSHNRTDEFKKLWNIRKNKPKSFSSYFKNYTRSKYYWSFINNWWQYRHDENVFMVHFNDLKKNPEKNIKEIALFLNIKVPEKSWPIILDHCSFAWMKKNSLKFETSKFTGAGKMIKDGGMIRKGGINEYKNLFSEDDHQVWERLHKKYFPDEQQRKWTDQGGQLP